jgi:hypothetical protein
MSSGGREVALVRQSLEDFREFTESELGASVIPRMAVGVECVKL